MTETQREALDIFLLANDVRALTRDLRADRLRLRARNLEALGFTEDEAWQLSRTSWRVQKGDDAA